MYFIENIIFYLFIKNVYSFIFIIIINLQQNFYVFFHFFYVERFNLTLTT